jgi:hypothetical protein
MNISWYINRLKTMSIPELFYRIKNLVFSNFEKIRYTGYFPKPGVIKITDKILPDIGTDYPLCDSKMEIFEKELDFSGDIDWHLDLRSNNRFPLIHSAKIEIRTNKYGSAKHVWEVNRLLFLPQICLNYKKTGNTLFLEKFMHFIDSWISENPYLLGVNWYSNIEVNIRLINWFICWEILDGAAVMKSEPSFKSFAENKWFPLIYLHCRHSRNHLSKYSSANNHLISEYAGLFIASSVWKFKESARWQKFARKGLETEIEKQHTNNGINREEAAEYIQFITDFFLVSYIIANKTGNRFSPAYEKMLKKIFGYIYAFTDRTGNYPKYGDEDDGQVFRFSREPENNFLSLLTTGAFLFNRPEYIKSAEADLKSRLLLGNEVEGMIKTAQGERKRQKSSFYPGDGHFIFRNIINNQEVFLHFDAAPLGYLSTAAHGHADALSFILHIDGKPVFVDPGTYTYHTDPEWRKYFISTLAHNTACINGKNQAIFGGSTLWVSRYKTRIIETSQNDEKEVVCASHDGYEKMGITHQRKIEFDLTKNSFLITDDLISAGTEESMVEILFHLSPDIQVTKETDISYLIKYDGVTIRLLCDGKLTSELIKGSINPLLGWYSGSFQRLKPTSVIKCFKLVKFTEQLNFEISIIAG